jgi:hypothetical protein
VCDAVVGGARSSQVYHPGPCICFDPPAPPALDERAAFNTSGNRYATRHGRVTETTTLNISLWVLQVLLALAFLAHGGLLLFPPQAMVEQMNASLPRWFQLFLGVAEVLAAIGLTLPGLTRIKPWLIPWAAAGIMVVMISATGFHFIRGEISSAITTLVLLALATAVAYLRWRVAPIRPRTPASNAGVAR